jgi:alkylation response protein AidB-like acyl-CoA dehydrogenase
MTSTPVSTASPLTTLTEDEAMFRDAVRDFAESEVRPRVDAMEQAAEFDRTLIPKYAELGLMGIDVDMDLGGAGGTFFMSILAVEELSAVDPSAAILVDVQNTLVNAPLLLWGNDDLKNRYLTRLAGGTVGAYALSEAGSGSDAFSLAARAEQKNGDWILNGTKLWITNGAEAEIFVVFATVNPSKGYKGITAFVVEREFDGFSVGKKEDKLGIRASSTTELILENCVVPGANVLGEVGKGYKVAIETLNGGRIGIGAQMIGVTRGALHAALKYVQERKQFGKPIADFQAVQFQLAQAATELEAAKLTVYNAARLRDAGEPYTKEAAVAKLFSSQVAERVTSLCLELFGGYGYTKEYPVEKFYRDAKIGTIYEGTSNMHLQTIAKLLFQEV